MSVYVNVMLSIVSQLVYLLLGVSSNPFSYVTEQVLDKSSLNIVQVIF